MRGGNIGAIKTVLDSFQKTPTITSKRGTFHPRGAFECTAFRPGFEIGKT
jgi:hypothetical protein